MIYLFLDLLKLFYLFSDIKYIFLWYYVFIFKYLNIRKIYIVCFHQPIKSHEQPDVTVFLGLLCVWTTQVGCGALN